MIFTIVIAAWLIAAVVRGWQRGLVATIISVVGSIVIWGAAFIFYNQFAALLSGNPDPGLGWRLGAFFLIVIGGEMIFAGLIRLSRAITWLPVIKQVNSIGGALVAGIFSYVTIFIALALLLMIQTPWIENQYNESQTAQFIAEHTPFVNSNQLQNWVGNDGVQQNDDQSGNQSNSQSSSSNSSSSQSAQ